MLSPRSIGAGDSSNSRNEVLTLARHFATMLPPPGEIYDGRRFATRAILPDRFFPIETADQPRGSLNGCVGVLGVQPPPRRVARAQCGHGWIVSGNTAPLSQGTNSQASLSCR